jgi:hypothetical protein
MKRKSAMTVVWATAAVAVLITAAPAVAQTFYREDFNLIDTEEPIEDGTLAFHGWDAAYIGTADPLNTAAMNSSGVVPAGAGGVGFHWWFNNTQLQDPVVRVTEASVTAAGEIPSPIMPVTDLAFIWEQRLENMQTNTFTATTGIPIEVRVAVQMENSNWYASEEAFATGDTGFGNGAGNWTAYTRPFTAAAAAWRNLTLNTLVPQSPTPQGATIGDTPASNLAGGIIGAGFVATFSQYSTINFNFLEIGIPPIPGDVDGDGDVDMDDFNTIRGNFGLTGAERTDGDLTGPGLGGLADGIVDLYDYGQWKDNFPFPGAGSGGGSVGGQSVPEPTTALLMAMPLICVMRLRRRRTASAPSPTPHSLQRSR